MHGNSVTIQGNVTRDAEVATTANGNNIVSFGIAWNASRKNQQGGYDDIPNFFEVKFWASDAQLRVVQDMIAKGASCAITEGHLVQERWEDKQGNNRSRVVVFVDDPIKGMLLKPKGGAQPSQQASYGGGGYGASQQSGGYSYSDDQPPLSVYDSDIPF